MKNKPFYFNNLYHISSHNKGLIASSEKKKLTDHPNSASGYKTYQKIDIENLLNRLFNPESCFKLFVLYNSFHKKYR